MSLIIDVVNDSASAAVPDLDQIQRWSEAAISRLPARDKPVSLGIQVVDEAASAQTNLAYRQKDYATNVLSFGVELPSVVLDNLDEVPIGDLVICAPVVAREAAEQGKSSEAHWAHMIVHGILHLHGHDHEDEADAQVMETLETDILLALGYNDPYQTN